MRFLIIFAGLLLLTACGSAATPQPTAVAAGVQITVPRVGTYLYEDNVTFSGTASNLPAAGFRLLVFTAEDTVLVDTPVIPETDGRWQHDFDTTTYTGDPTEITVLALPIREDTTESDAIPDLSNVAEYAGESAVLADKSLRPEAETYGIIFFPAPDDPVGGDVIPVTGSASGVPDGEVLIQLVAGADSDDTDDETILAEQRTLIAGGYSLNEIPWEVNLAPGDYRGPAQLRLMLPDSGEELDSIRVDVVEAAG